MSKAIFEQLMQARERTTEGEWEIDPSAAGDDVRTRADVKGGIICEAPLDWEESMKDWPANAAFITLSHASLPAIAEWVKGLEERVKQLESKPSLTVNDQITDEQVKQASLAAHITRIRHHDCGVCGVWVAYMIGGDSLYFDSECGCGSYRSPMRPCEWSEAADWINMQTNPQAKIEIAARFGLVLSLPAEGEKGGEG